MLAETLKVNTATASLKLSHNKIGEAWAKSVASILFWKDIGDMRMASLAEALRVNTAITLLYLSSNEIGGAGAASLAGALKVNAAITTLKLRIIKSETRGRRRRHRLSGPTLPSPH